MKLTKEDKKLLKDWGYPDEDLAQIERATTKTIYLVNDEKISRDKAIEILGRETYLNGLSRSAFHWNCGRENTNGVYVHFDSSKLFE